MTQNILSAQKENFRSIDLRKKTRFGESVIQALLFIAGILSVSRRLPSSMNLARKPCSFLATLMSP